MNIIRLDECRTYKTEANLMAALERLGFATHRFIIACTAAGRFTAIFPATNFKGGGYMGLYAQHGFLTIG